MPSLLIYTEPSYREQENLVPRCVETLFYM